MSNKVPFAVFACIIGFIIIDVLVLRIGVVPFLFRKLIELIGFIAFWR
jgi:hypothetical protein